MGVDGLVADGRRRDDPLDDHLGEQPEPPRECRPDDERAEQVECGGDVAAVVELLVRESTAPRGEQDQHRWSRQLPSVAPPGARFPAPTQEPVPEPGGEADQRGNDDVGDQLPHRCAPHGVLERLGHGIDQRARHEVAGEVGLDRHPIPHDDVVVDRKTIDLLAPTGQARHGVGREHVRTVPLAALDPGDRDLGARQRVAGDPTPGDDGRLAPRQGELGGLCLCDILGVRDLVDLRRREPVEDVGEARERQHRDLVSIRAGDLREVEQVLHVGQRRREGTLRLLGAIRFIVAQQLFEQLHLPDERQVRRLRTRGVQRLQRAARLSGAVLSHRRSPERHQQAHCDQQRDDQRTTTQPEPRHRPATSSGRPTLHRGRFSPLRRCPRRSPASGAPLTCLDLCNSHSNPPRSGPQVRWQIDRGELRG